MTSPAHAPFFFADVGPDAETVTLGPEDSRHLAVVRRATPGDLIHVSDGRGSTYSVEIQSVAPARVTGQVTSTWSVGPPRPEVRIFQALAKGSKIDWAIQKLVEIGTDEITVFTSERTEKRWNAERTVKARDRWKKIALEAAKQSHRVWLPKVEGPVGLESVVSQLSGTGVVGDLNATQSLRQLLQGITDVGSVYAVVGPEGGLTEKEVDSLEAAGARRVRIGGSILRTETAPIVLATALMYQFGRLG